MTLPISHYPDLVPMIVSVATCLDCHREWTALHSLAADDLECPDCGGFNTVREEPEN